MKEKFIDYLYISPFDYLYSLEQFKDCPKYTVQKHKWYSLNIIKINQSEHIAILEAEKEMIVMALQDLFYEGYRIEHICHIISLNSSNYITGTYLPNKTDYSEIHSAPYMDLNLNTPPKPIYKIKTKKTPDLEIVNMINILSQNYTFSYFPIIFNRVSLLKVKTILQHLTFVNPFNPTYLED